MTALAPAVIPQLLQGAICKDGFRHIKHAWRISDGLWADGAFLTEATPRMLDQIQEAYGPVGEYTQRVDRIKYDVCEIQITIRAKIKLT